MHKHFSRLRETRTDQSGINMVDLMMWLVIAALLLAAALQSIGYYQKAAHLQNMKSDLSGIGSRVMSESAIRGGSLDLDTLKEGARLSSKSKNVKVTVEESSTNGKPYVRASSTLVGGVDAIYLFESCGSYGIGVTVIPKGGDASCGIAVSPPPPLSFALTETADFLGATWRAVGMSGDGKVMLAGRDNGGFRVSTDSGSTWVDHNEIPVDTTWRGMAVSFTGNTMIIGQNNGSLYLSRDKGVTWQAQPSLGVGAWRAVHVSPDGTMIIASKAGSGVIWYSTNSGTSWSSKAAPGNANIYGITASDDGKKIAAVNYGENLFLSNDSGATWTAANLPAYTSAWGDIASSSDGRVIVAGNDTGWLQTSTDSGATWMDHSELARASWRAVSISSDGKTMVAVQFNSGSVFTSSDSGKTWDEISDPANTYLTGEISDDGSKMILAGSGTVKVGAVKK